MRFHFHEFFLEYGSKYGGLVIDADCLCYFHADIEYEFLEDPKMGVVKKIMSGRDVKFLYRTSIFSNKNLDVF